MAQALLLASHQLANHQRIDLQSGHYGLERMVFEARGKYGLRLLRCFRVTLGAAQHAFLVYLHSNACGVLGNPGCDVAHMGPAAGLYVRFAF